MEHRDRGRKEKCTYGRYGELQADIKKVRKVLRWCTMMMDGKGREGNETKRKVHRTARNERKKDQAAGHAQLAKTRTGTCQKKVPPGLDAERVRRSTRCVRGQKLARGSEMKSGLGRVSIVGRQPSEGEGEVERKGN